MSSTLIVDFNEGVVDVLIQNGVEPRLAEKTWQLLSEYQAHWQEDRAMLPVKMHSYHSLQISLHRYYCGCMDSVHPGVCVKETGKGHVQELLISPRLLQNYDYHKVLQDD